MVSRLCDLQDPKAYFSVYYKTRIGDIPHAFTAMAKYIL